jgi:2-phosphosulfolactate phosphatase
MRLEVIFSPAELEALQKRDLSRAACVVFDILRATSSMITALANGAARIIPVKEIEEALLLRKSVPGALLAGERHGLRIGPDLAGGTAFDLGNSPREFAREQVQGRTIVMTTTNGTRALKACSGAGVVLIGTFLALGSLKEWVARTRPEELLLVGSGTEEEVSLEDSLAAGALADHVWEVYAKGQIADSAQMARQLYLLHKNDLLGAMGLARNGRRLLNLPDLREDVPFCLRQNAHEMIAGMEVDGSVVAGEQFGRYGDKRT